MATRAKRRPKAGVVAAPRDPTRPAKQRRARAYKPEYADMLLRHMAQGLTFTSFAAECDVCRDTLYEWLQMHPDFADARARGMPLLELYYLRLGHSIAMGEFKSAPAVFIFMTKNLLHWRDQTDVQLSGRDGGAIAVKAVQQTFEEKIAEVDKLRALRESCGDD